MGISLWATSTANSITIGYQHDFDVGDDSTPVDISIQVNHDYQSSNFDNQTVVLKTIVVPASYVKVQNHDDGTVTHTASSTIVNLRYTSNLFLQSSETRNLTPVFSSRVEVLDTGDLGDEPLPSNPVRERAFEENVPAIRVESPTDDISVMQPIVSPVIDEGVEAENLRTKIVIDPETDEFTRGTSTGLIEDAAVNYAVNPTFGTAQRVGLVYVPTGYNISAPGFILDSSLFAGTITDTSVWRIAASNPNTFNAFNSLGLDLGTAVVPAGSQVWTWSMYARYTSEGPSFPFDSFTVSWQFLTAANFLVGMTTKTISVTGIDDWQLLSCRVSGPEIPPSATQVKISLNSASIEQTDRFAIQFYLPQLEALGEPTSRMVTARPVADVYRTPDTLDLNLPCYIALETTHQNSPMIRGLLDTTTALKSGVQFYASADRLFFKQLSPIGGIVFSKLSSTFSLVDGQPAIYGVFLDGTNIKFYLNNVLVSTHVQPVTLSQVGIKPLVGSLVMPNTSLNTKISRFGVFRVAPV